MAPSKKATIPKKRTAACNAGICNDCIAKKQKKRQSISGAEIQEIVNESSIYRGKTPISWSHDDWVDFSHPERLKDTGTVYIQRPYRHYCLQRAFNNCVGRELIRSRDMQIGQEMSEPGSTHYADGDWCIGHLHAALKARELPFRLIRMKGLKTKTDICSQESGVFLVFSSNDFGQGHAVAIDMNHRVLIDGKKRHVLSVDDNDNWLLLFVRVIRKVYKLQTISLSSK